MPPPNPPASISHSHSPSHSPPSSSPSGRSYLPAHHASPSAVAAASSPSRIASPSSAATWNVAHMYHNTSRPVTAVLVPLSAEQRARQLIHLSLREAATGQKTLQHVCVPSYRIVGDLVLYDILVQAADNLRWLLTRRFAEFAALNSALENSVRNVESLPPFPSKEWRWTTDHLSPEFLQQRQALLDNYCRKILGMSKLRGCSSFLEFLRPSREDLMDSPTSPQPTPAAAQQANSHSNSNTPTPSNGGVPNGTQPGTPGRSPYNASPIVGHGAVSPSTLPAYPSSTTLAAASEAIASTSMTDAMFEPRSYEDEAKSERRERLASMSANSEAGTSFAVSPSMSPSSSSMAMSRRTSRSQIYDPPPPTHVSFAPPGAAAASNAIAATAAAAATSSHAFPSPLSSDVPLWLSPEVSDVSIPAAQVLRGDHTVFQVNVENIAKLSSFSRWTVLKRYVEFWTLDQSIRAHLQAAPGGEVSSANAAALAKLPLLPKRESKLLTDHLQNRFIEKRRLLLEVYLKSLITLPEICTLDCVLDFLGCN